MDPEPSILFFYFTQNFNYWLPIGIATLLSLLFSSAMISGSEVAYFSLSKGEIDQASASNSKSQQTIAQLLNRPQKLLATILIANNFINILIVLIFHFVGEQLLEEVSSVWWLKLFIEFVVVTFLILLFGEVLPKIYANRNAMKFASIMALPLKLVSALLSFVSVPMLNLTNVIENKLAKKQSNISVEKLSQALELTNTESVEGDDHKILEGIVSFGNTETSQIMTPRIDIFAISDDEPYEKVVDLIVKKGFSRNPVYKDNVDEIVGVLYAKDLLPHLHKQNFNWQKLLRAPYFVPENKKLDDLLKEFQEKKNHLAVVVDEYGGTSGIVTLEDVIEEIVGDINDEFDDDDLSYTKIDQNTYLFEGKTNLKDFYKVLNIENNDPFDEQKGEAETIAGFVLEICGRFPKKNEVIQFQNVAFKIESLDKKRIKRMKITIDR